MCRARLEWRCSTWRTTSAVVTTSASTWWESNMKHGIPLSCNCAKIYHCTFWIWYIVSKHSPPFDQGCRSSLTLRSCTCDPKEYVFVFVLLGRVAEVVRGLGGPLPKSLDSDENFKPKYTLFCRELRFVAIYALFGDLWAKKCLFGSKTVFLGQEVYYYILYIAYPIELNLQICDYAQKQGICRKNCK